MTKFTEILGKKGGISILGLLFLGFIIILVLSYFHISIKTVVESPDAQENVDYFGGASKSLWDSYLKEPAHYIWNIWVELFWNPFIKNIKMINETGHSEDLENAGPTLRL